MSCGRKTNLVSKFNTQNEFLTDKAARLTKKIAKKNINFIATSCAGNAKSSKKMEPKKELHPSYTLVITFY